jgi:cysteine desulfurase
VLPQVVDAILPYLREHFGNPSSTHIYGRRAHEALERRRGQVAALIGCDPKEILFSSGGTESNILAILATTQHGVQRRVVDVRDRAPRDDVCGGLARAAGMASRSCRR